MPLTFTSSVFWFKHIYLLICKKTQPNLTNSQASVWNSANWGKRQYMKHLTGRNSGKFQNTTTDQACKLATISQSLLIRRNQIRRIRLTVTKPLRPEISTSHHGLDDVLKTSYSGVYERFMGVAMLFTITTNIKGLFKLLTKMFHIMRGRRG